MENKDIRMKNISEVFGSLLTIKLNAWEEKFRVKILSSREIELKYVWGVNVLTSINVFLLWLAPNIVSVATIAVYARLLHNDITAEKIFTALSLFRLLQSPLREFPRYITQLYQAFTSIERLQTVLQMEEKQNSLPSSPSTEQGEGAREVKRGTEEGESGSLELRHCSFHWYSVPSATTEIITKTNDLNMIPEGDTRSHPTFTLQIPSLSIHGGEFVIVRGIVGQGKSSLCHALLSEMTLAPPPSHTLLHSSCQADINGTIAYASQLPWIQNMTIRQNILHNCPYDQQRYLRVLHSCCLLEDLVSFPSGDQTFIGQKGINLSGGQKSRIALARAIYSDHEIFILDDVFAALDTIVGKRVFDRVLCGLLRNKTRILVTHKEEFIRHSEVNQILTLQNGTVEIDVCQPVAKREGRQGTSILDVDYVISSEDYQQLHAIVTSSASVSSFSQPLNQENSNDGDNDSTRNYSYDAASQSQPQPQALPEDHLSAFESVEEKESGSVSARVYSEYAKAAGGYHVIALLVLVQTTWQLLSVGSDIFITSWANEDSQEQQDHLSLNIAIYALLAVGSGFVVLIRTLTIAYYGYYAGRSLFNSMLQSLLYAPMWWIDKNPTGR
jgi:ABC-type lipoprotein export system ATPase subunit